MKKLALLLALLSITLVACGNDKEIAEVPDTNDTIEESAEQKKEELPLPIVNVKDIAGKTREEVKQIIGDENPVQDGDNNLLYNDGEIDVHYVDDKAANITVTPKEPYLYKDKKKILALIGLEWQEPDEEEDIFTEWLYIDNIYKVKIFPEFENFKDIKENLNYIYVITDEIYK